MWSLFNLLSQDSHFYDELNIVSTKNGYTSEIISHLSFFFWWLFWLQGNLQWIEYTSTLVGPTGNVPVLDTLAVLHVDNQLSMLQFLTLPYEIIFWDIFKPKYYLPHQSSYWATYLNANE